MAYQAKAIGKIVTLAQKLKMHKNMLKTFLQHIAVVLCKKWPKMAKNGHQAKAIDFAKSSLWVKN